MTCRVVLIVLCVIYLSLSLSLSAASGYNAAVPQGRAEEGGYIAGPGAGEVS